MTEQSKRWVNRPEGSNWGDFGADDELGRLNLLTPERTLRAAKEIKAGQSFCLSLPLDRPAQSQNPFRHPPQIFAGVRGDGPFYHARISRMSPAYTDVGNDDMVLMHTQYSTQWDALCHVGSEFDADGDGSREIVFYNGWRGGDHVVPAPHGAEPHEPLGYEGVRARRLGIENYAVKGVQGRGVLVNLKRRFGEQSKLVRCSDLEAIFREDGITVEEGDILCLYTGYADVVLELGERADVDRLKRSCAMLDGADQALLDWITASGVAAIAADNYGVEGVPEHGTPEAKARIEQAGGKRIPWLPLHEHCLFKLGIPLGELWYFTELAAWLDANRRSRFFLTAPALRLPGAVGSPLTPIATV